jgi:hypothetical protein
VILVGLGIVTFALARVLGLDLGYP